MTDLTKIKRRLSRLDQKQLDEISSYCRKRSKIISSRVWQEKKVAAWERAKAWQPGQVLYCCASGTFLGGPLQRGDKLTVHAIQPRKRRLWCKINERFWGFPPGEIHRYNLQTESPPDSATLLDCHVAAKLGGAIEAVLN